MAITTGWPTREQYMGAALASEHHFLVPELRGATFASAAGRPILWSGGRAVVFKATSPTGERLAVRCLLGADPARAARYQALANHLADHPAPPFLAPRWSEQGVIIGAAAHPVITMPWVDGVTLDEHLRQHQQGGPADPKHVLALSERWTRVAASVSRAQLAHGDVHAENVVVRRGSDPTDFCFVDYDSVWTPALAHHPGDEVGHPAYQHPARRPCHWGPWMDAFSHTVMYLSLRAIAADPGLWARFHGGDVALLFQADDLAGRTDRGLWEALSAQADATVGALVRVLRTWLDGAPDLHHSLEEAIEAADAGGPSRPNSWPAPSRQVSAGASPEQRWMAAATPPAEPPRSVGGIGTSGAPNSWNRPTSAHDAAKGSVRRHIVPMWAMVTAAGSVLLLVAAALMLLLLR